MEKLKVAFIITVVVITLSFLHASCAGTKKDFKGIDRKRQEGGVYL